MHFIVHLAKLPLSLADGIILALLQSAVYVGLSTGPAISLQSEISRLHTKKISSH